MYFTHEEGRKANGHLNLSVFLELTIAPNALNHTNIHIYI